MTTPYLQAYNKATGEEVNLGDLITVPSGSAAKLIHCTAQTVTGKSGKVYVQWLDDDNVGEYYAHVFGLEVDLIEPKVDRKEFYEALGRKCKEIVKKVLNDKE